MSHAKSGGFENVSEGGSLDRFVRRYGKIECFQGEVLSQTDMTPFLPDDHPAVALKSFNDFDVGKAGNLGHTAMSSCSALAA